MFLFIIRQYLKNLVQCEFNVNKTKCTQIYHEKIYSKKRITKSFSLTDGSEVSKKGVLQSREWKIIFAL